MRKLQGLLLIIIASWGLVLMPQMSLAEAGNLNCLPDGSVANDLNGRPTNFFDTSTSSNDSACQTTLRGVNHVFSEITCNFITVLNDVLTKVYCSLQSAIKDTVALVLTLYVMFFGAQLLMGMTQLNSSEIMVRLLKIAFVWVLVTESSWMIGWVFNFFVDFGSSGIYWALGSIPINDPTFGTVAGPANPGDPLTPSTCIGQLYQYTNFSGISSITPVYAFFDQLIYCAVLAPLASASLKVIGFFLVMAIVIPPLFMMALYWLWSILSVLARGLVSFLMSLSALAFLITISPIFLCLMLFKSTYQFFENWIKYMISFSLQTVIVFACIALWATTIPLIVTFFTELSSVVFDGRNVVQVSQALPLGKKLGICPYDLYVNPGGGSTPHIKCNKPTFNPATDTTDEKSMVLLEALAVQHNDPNTPSFVPVCPATQPPPGSTCGQREMGPLIYYVIYHMITLIIITYAFDALLKAAPQIATTLAGPEYLFTVGQGFGASGFGLTGKGTTQRLKQQTSSGGGSSIYDTVRAMSSRNPISQFEQNAGAMATQGRNRPAGA